MSRAANSSLRPQRFFKIGRRHRTHLPMGRREGRIASKSSTGSKGLQRREYREGLSQNNGGSQEKILCPNGTSLWANVPPPWLASIMMMSQQWAKVDMGGSRREGGDLTKGNGPAWLIPCARTTGTQSYSNL